MQFSHSQQHTPASIGSLDVQLSQPTMSLRKRLSLATDLVQHGHCDAAIQIGMLRRESRRSEVQDYCDLLEGAWRNLRQHFQLENQTINRFTRFYHLNGGLLQRPLQPSGKLLVVFTTIYNNFWISSLALASLLEPAGVNVMILKDATHNHYHRGVDGFANDIPGITQSIQALAKNLNADSIFVSGFSSGGYAAMLVSLMLQCRGYLGFSHQVDLSEGSTLPSSLFLPDAVRAQLDQRWFLDLRTLLDRADPQISRTLIYGDRSPRDVAHAKHLEGNAAIQLVKATDIGHNTVLKLLRTGEFIPMFTQMLES